jgi:7-cyano-7-deazaguanine tRNA-ribosyltransferase
MNKDLEKIRAIADYQFGYQAGKVLFPDSVRLEYSKNTGRIRHIFFGEDLLANFRPNDGLFTLTIAGAERLIKGLPDLKYKVRLLDDLIEFIEQGKNLFAKHVVEAHPDIRPGQEVIVVDGEDNTIAVGKTILTPEEMLSFETGVAVKIRRGRKRHR